MSMLAVQLVYWVDQLFEIMKYLNCLCSLGFYNNIYNLKNNNTIDYLKCGKEEMDRQVEINIDAFRQLLSSLGSASAVSFSVSKTSTIDDVASGPQDKL